MSEWRNFQLGAVASFKKGINYTSSDYSDEDAGRPFITIKCFVKGGGYEPEGLKFIRGGFSKEDQLSEGDILFSVTDLTRAGDIVGSPLRVPFYGNDTYAVASMDCMKAEPFNGICDTGFLYQRMMLSDIRRQMVAYSAGSTVLHLDTKQVPRISARMPAELKVQQKIASILQTADQAIEKTEALIEKYQQIKAGLMHDLFTRGIGADGKLRLPREQAPELYRQTPIGWLPKEWDLATIDTIKENLVDGPFGSNLKTEHYVSDPGVRVVRLQNIQSTKYNDEDRAFVSDKHANNLYRNKVIGNDILIAGLGEDRYPVGRACLYPNDLPPAINKADCFRLRSIDGFMDNGFLMYFLNTSAARAQVRKYEQGVTRPRINLGNMKKLIAPQPEFEEQVKIFEKLEYLEARIALEKNTKNKLLHEKSGLMHDLLTGKVAVQTAEAEQEPV